MARKLIGEILIEAGLINEYQLARALGQQKQWGGKLGAEMIRLGYIKEENLAAALETQLGVKWISLHDIKISPETILCVGPDLAKKYLIIPVMCDEKTVTLATMEPNDLKTLDTLGFILGRRVKTVIATKTDIKWAISYYYDNAGESAQASAASAAHPSAAASPSAPAAKPVVSSQPKVAAPIVAGPSATAPAVKSPSSSIVIGHAAPPSDVLLDPAVETLIELLEEKGILTRSEFLIRFNSRDQF